MGSEWSGCDDLGGCQCTSMSWNLIGFYLSNVIMKPFSAQCSSGTSIVPIVVTGHVLENIVHSPRRNTREERLDETLVD